MPRKTKIAGGAALAVVLAIVGDITLTAGAQASTEDTSDDVNGVAVKNGKQD
ncbi:MAG: hypothetical protein LH475_03705 [Cryobacterium sp.]|uniref:hypothetical protein n=1 Tax=unclassified Cryobacterium TaxID=2649013 RepID=UPI0018CB4669|nr:MULTISPECIES: hypothetical protein [unclassified Cryobacterium]MCY7403726.1 hypothetical protein [Cryobacterium sp.]MEC5155580.1 hypothetical protein [Cryobacterium sp. CAN_C3]